MRMGDGGKRLEGGKNDRALGAEWEREKEGEDCGEVGCCAESHS